MKREYYIGLFMATVRFNLRGDEGACKQINPNKTLTGLWRKDRGLLRVVNSVSTEPMKRRYFETATHSTYDFKDIFPLYLTDESHSGSWVGPFIPHSCLTDCSSEKWQTEEWRKEMRGKIFKIAKSLINVIWLALHWEDIRVLFTPQGAVAWQYSS